MDIPRFYRKDEFSLIHFNLKFYLCPFCKKRGFLILHGFVRGYTITGYRVIKGHRIYCSNRNNRKGCGHTWSIYLRQYIPGFSIDVETLSTILSSSNNLFKGWKENETGLSISSFYRIIDKFNRHILNIRTYLTNRYKPPLIDEYPITTTIKHLQSLNKNLDKALSLFQFTFQVSILS